MKNTIADIQKQYSGQIDRLDLELLIADAIKKPREFVLSHPEYELPSLKIKNLKLKIARRMRAEPLAYILGSREFFGLPFLVTPATLIPRPETELMVEEALQELREKKPACPAGRQETRNKKQALPVIVDVGTGSGNIIISIAKNYKLQPTNYFGIDLSPDALAIAKKNARANGVAGKIKFMRGNLLEPLLQNSKFEIRNSKFILLANLPYLSRDIYNATLPTVKKFEPKSALFSPDNGLSHYGKLLRQINALQIKDQELQATILLEISPEQKTKLPALVKKYLPGASVRFKKDLARKWRLCKIIL